MPKEIWINLPVNNVAKARDFYVSLGFTFNETHSNNSMAAMQVSDKNISLMLFDANTFSHINQIAVTDTKSSAEVLFSLDAASKEEVDNWAKKAAAAGGSVFAPPAVIQGWMYGCAFTDLDGHRWNVLHMDMSQMNH
jgi:uncharacterized protein